MNISSKYTERFNSVANERDFLKMWYVNYYVHHIYLFPKLANNMLDLAR